MLSLKNQYLREMGVDVWRLRPHFPDSSASLHSEAQQDLSIDPAPESRPELSPGLTTKARHPTQSIERPGSRTVKAAAVTSVQSGVPETAATPVPEFHLCFATYNNGLSLVFSAPLSAPAVPDRYRRFADDIALAFSSQARMESQVTSLRWPMVQASHIAQSEEDARLIVGKRIEMCADKLVLFGQAPSHYVADTRPCIKVEEIELYFDEPLRKRDLWLALRSFLDD
ncbi:MAG: hypothetical protein WD558_07600 [Pseudomonadales bacterium]